ncbi:uncharacterized protein B0H18DRAFT_1116058 [Fomitopsis serialis]|uniref:uncharacterized protein n=1 Tax=Fomitopsis serialis TaxID=139415 RepID=UPI00200824FD|nr:uncharacterized protein B0H18DRAFT_1116058 [Neoantrodia serialis]KAH9931789.1 hypothetical protein B0H18DRAFT_1116058 [Neoantrodia serialis]
MATQGDGRRHRDRAGDVGYLDKGSFCRLFNALRDKEDLLNNKPHRAPDGFTIDMQPKRTNNAISAGPLLSRTVKRVGEMAETAVHGAKVGFEFECARRMKAYMKKNIDSWVYYATEVLGMEKRLNEILFVRGWVKTTHCIFLHYFKMKRRLVLPAKIEAAAEPHDASSVNDDEDDEDEEAPLKRKWYDPVDHVFDYILQNSDATEAIASDSDILEICKNNGPSEYPIPDDIPTFLETVWPEIELTSNGLGMLLFNNDTTILAESAALAQRNAANPAGSKERPPEEQIGSQAGADSDSTRSSARANSSARTTITNLPPTTA